MTKTKKAPDAVALAVAAHAEAVERWKSAQAAVEVARVEMLAAQAAIREARVAADSHMPRCVVEKVFRWDGRAEEVGPAVIVRKTPAGSLVVRYMGDAGEIRFAFNRCSGRFEQAQKGTWMGARLVLRDVPAEFTGAKEAA